MSETITAIDEYAGEHSEEESWGTWTRKEAGFKVTTTEQQIVLAIDDESSCCESWGYFLSEDDTGKFIGAELRGVEITDTNLSTRVFKKYEWNDPESDNDNVIDVDEGDTMFVNILTDRGTLQFVAYNAHNGYYGHAARVSSKQLTHSVTL